ncbi:hypothetical protein EDM52_24315 [Brevibacillus invocatus]|uniref:Uncharacterized protein n=2 Tax=Brevibacillus invocatus TaxID=173959 RepID=A0A3M8BGN1_9BACL|nr:hypothetical protein EDM52_24315 [Brevibacillus invocatus]
MKLIQIVKSTTLVKVVRGDKERKEAYEFSNYKNELTLSDYRLKNMRFVRLQEDLQESYQKTISAIARYLRRTVLLKHKSCIKRYFKENEREKKCPYAFAYLHWRYFIQGFASIRHVDEALPGMGVRKLDSKYIEFPSWQDDEYLRNLFSEVERRFEDITTETRASMKWIFNRVIAHIVSNRFWGWLQEAPTLMENYLSLGLPPRIIIVRSSSSDNFQLIRTTERE